MDETSLFLCCTIGIARQDAGPTRRKTDVVKVPAVQVQTNRSFFFEGFRSFHVRSIGEEKLVDVTIAITETLASVGRVREPHDLHVIVIRSGHVEGDEWIEMIMVMVDGQHPAIRVE